MILPAALTAVPNWVTWRSEQRNGGKPTKVPYSLVTGRRASSTEPSDWAPYPDKPPDNIGFVFTKSLHITGIDLDDCLTEDGFPKPWATVFMERFANTYSEVSPSGKGVKIWAGGSIPGTGKKVYITSEGVRVQEGSADIDGAVEMYDTGRYFTVTGKATGPLEITDCQPLLDELYAKLSGERKPSRPAADNILGAGSRHGYLLASAAQWRQNGLDREGILIGLRELNQRKCNPPKPERELVGIIDWISSKPPKYRLVPADFVEPVYVTGAAVPNSEPDPPPAKDAFTRAQEIIDSKNVRRVYEEDFIDSVARLKEFEWARIKLDLETGFKAAFPKADWMKEVKRRAAAYAPLYATPNDWRAELITRMTKDGPVPASCVTNAMLYLENHPDWAGKLRWNEFTGEPLVVGDLPHPVNLAAGEQVRDHHDTLVQSWFEIETRDPKWNIDIVRRSVDCWAKAHAFNPVRDYLNGLAKWDGVQRLNSWLVNYCAAEPEKSDDRDARGKLLDFISAIGRRWWISAIARAFDPGCQVHHVLVLEGSKGIGKTTLAQIIFDEYYAVILGDVNSKDNQALMSSGVWGVLLDELDVLSKSEKRAVKSWVTRDFEKFRPTWGYRHEKRKRQCVFIATVNDDDWAAEEDRRWWPVSCNGPFDLIGLRRDRDLLMAEALHHYRAGERWYFDNEEDAALIVTAKQQQAARLPDNVLGEIWLKTAFDVAKSQPMSRLLGSASVAEILEKLEVPMDKRKGHQQDCGKALKAAGWKQFRPRIDGEPGDRRWLAPEYQLTIP